jgi:3-methyl-2-oxobutanoate hydroxymethyltransferase
MGHVGLMPQHMHRYGGFKTQGKTSTAAKAILQDAKAIAQAGAFSIVLEGIPASLAASITKSITIPTIGIGASPRCDGQVLVIDDMLGMFDSTPKFVKRYAQLARTISAAAADYAHQVKSGAFPAAEHCYEVINPKLVKKG